jgi:precorrin-2 dehydrogenase/sirohydrochlorin ferrochelatase
MLPLLLNLTDRLIVVIGGGPVGRRKAAAVRAAGGSVRLICLEPRPPEIVDPHIDWRTEAYSPAQLEGAALVFAAGPPELNDRILADAHERGIWVNMASEPKRGDFFLPATVQRGDFVLAISTGGAAPLVTQQVRAQLEARYDELFGTWVHLLAELRPQVMERIPDAVQRERVLRRLSRWEWLERLRQEEVARVRTALQLEIESATR